MKHEPSVNMFKNGLFVNIFLFYNEAISVMQTFSIIPRRFKSGVFFTLSPTYHAAILQVENAFATPLMPFSYNGKLLY